MPASAAERNRARTARSAPADGATDFGYAKWVGVEPIRSSIALVERSSSSSTRSWGSRSNNAWVWVWEPMVTRPVATVSCTAAQDIGGAPYGNGSWSSRNAVARYIVAGMWWRTRTGTAVSAKSAGPSSNVTTIGSCSGTSGAANASSAASSVTTRFVAASTAICSSKRSTGRSSSRPEPRPTQW